MESLNRSFEGPGPGTGTVQGLGSSVLSVDHGTATYSSRTTGHR